MTTGTFNLPGIQRWSKPDVGPYLESDIAESAISLEANERCPCLIGLLEKADSFFEILKPRRFGPSRRPRKGMIA